MAAFAVSGCRQGPNPDSSPSAFQVVNAVGDSGDLAASVDGKQIFGKVGYGDDSGLYGVQPGRYDIAVTVDAENVPVPFGTTPIAVDAQRHYTAIAFGVPLAPNRLAIFSVPKPTDQERKVAEASGKSTVRVFNAAQGADKVDVLVNSIVAFKNVPYGGTSDAIPLASLPYEWNVKPAGDSDDDYINPVTIDLKSGHHYVVVIMGSVADSDIQIKAYEE